MYKPINNKEYVSLNMTPLKIFQKSKWSYIIYNSVVI